MGDRDALEKEINECMRHFSEYGTSLQKYRIFILELVAEIFRFGNNNNLNVDEIFGDGSNYLEKGFQAESPEELWNWLMEISGRMQDVISKERQKIGRASCRERV